MNDKIFVKESFKIILGEVEFKDGSREDVQNVEVYSKANVIPWVESLERQIPKWIPIKEKRPQNYDGFHILVYTDRVLVWDCQHARRMYEMGSDDFYWMPLPQKP